MDKATPLSLARIAVGVAACAAPELSLRAMMLDDTGPGARLFVRLFGVRDLALGVATLVAPPADRTALLAVGMVVDAGDAATGLLALRSGAVKAPVGLGITGSGTSAALAALVAIRPLRRR
jgi:hypothetical protein